jgi:phosphoribosylformimino-5-aminoimidazole carboxamide ribonucleotide (ProFAR) isomerase
MSTVKEIINDAGGVSVVAMKIRITERSVYKWIERNALPRSEYTGETNYSSLIAVLCKSYSREKILQIGNPRKIRDKNNFNDLSI